MALSVSRNSVSSFFGVLAINSSLSRFPESFAGQRMFPFGAGGAPAGIVRPGQSWGGSTSTLAALLGRNLLAFLAGLGHADRDRLLLARHLLPAPAALQR